MRTDRRQSAMTLVEILVVLAVILIMIGALGGAGIHLKRQSEIRLTEGTIGVLVMALEQYYTDQSDYVPQISDQTQFNSSVGVAATTIRPPAVHWTGALEAPAWSGEALYYFLNRSPNAAAIIGVLMDRVISNKDAAGRPLVIEIPTGGTAYDLIRFVDAWGMPIRYAYDPARDQFPILTSAGPDKRFDTASDNITNQ
jgi:prepilin-type N-terminal cleavage/methylation domain-containing protein